MANNDQGQEEKEVITTFILPEEPSAPSGRMIKEGNEKIFNKDKD